MPGSIIPLVTFIFIGPKGGADGRVQMNKINDSLLIFIRPKSEHNDCLHLSMTESLTGAFEI